MIVKPGDIIYMILDDIYRIDTPSDISKIDTAFVIIGVEKGRLGAVELRDTNVHVFGESRSEYLHIDVRDKFLDEMWFSTQEEAIRAGIQQHVQNSKQETVDALEVQKWFLESRSK